MNDSRPLIIGLGSVDASIVAPVLGPTLQYFEHPAVSDFEVAEGAIVRAAYAVTRDLIDHMPNLRVLARTGVGVDLVDMAATAERGIPVVVTPGSNTNAVAEGALAHALHLVKRLQPLTDLVRSGRWEQRDGITVGDLEGATIGIVGYGRIGRRVGHLAAGFGMTVLAYDPISQPEPLIAVDSLLELIERSNVITLHAPLTPDTLGLIGRDLLEHTRPGTVLVNCGRGALVDLDAALAALNSGRLGGIGLDVFDPEPPAHHPLFDHPDVVLTPHVMGLSARATRATFIAAAQGVVDVLAGRTPAAIAVMPTIQRGIVS